ncbi:MAG: pentapeptide repeat-containing protein [Desulfobulbaceae bacterium]|nr:pentapeptide repeat-containing protein [Desulfobulbaceae bacterium]
MLKSLFLLLLATHLLVACAPTTATQLIRDKNGRQLSAEEILLLVRGNTLFVHGNRFEIYLYFDDTSYVHALDIYNKKDSGRWDVSEQGELCIKMNEWWFGKLRCLPVYHDGSKYYLFNSSGVLEYTADRFEGDKKNLYHDTKSSERKFLNSPTREATARRPSLPDTAPPEPETAGVTPPVGAPTEEELKSTVKWMAKDCPDCNLADTNLAGADLIAANLQSADLSGADLSKANLRRADLRGANLKNADLSYANMPGADLRDSDLTNAVLKGANLIRAKLNGAKIEGTDFEGALLEGVEGLQQ